MNATEPNEKDETLKRLLRRWEVKAALPSGFREQVWNRIEPSQGQHDFGAFAWFVGYLEGALRRPAVALGYVVILLVMGSAFGWSQAQSDQAQMKETLGQRYVWSIDPYQRLR